MEEKEKFLSIVNEAEDTLENLKKLKSEIGSYGEAKLELSKVRENLSKMIDKTEELIESSNEAVKISKEVGIPEIVENLQKLNSDVGAISSEYKEVIEENKEKLSDQLTNVNNNLDEESKLVESSFKKMRTFLYIAIGLSGVSLIISIVGLVIG